MRYRNTPKYGWWIYKSPIEGKTLVGWESWDIQSRSRRISWNQLMLIIWIVKECYNNPGSKYNEVELNIRSHLMNLDKL